MRIWIGVAAILAGLSVALGAFAAHGLAQRLAPAMLSVFETGARYQMYHALGLGLAALALQERRDNLARAVPWLFVSGILLFCGSLYLLAVTGLRFLGAVTPLGGVLFLAGWALLAATMLRR